MRRRERRSAVGLRYPSYQDKWSLEVDVHSPVMSHQAKVTRVCVCEYKYRGDVDVLHLIDPCKASEVISYNGDLTT